MDTDKVLKELEKIEKFKNINISYNESKNIYDVYARIKGDEENTKDILNNIEYLDYTFNSKYYFYIIYIYYSITFVLFFCRQNQ